MNANENAPATLEVGQVYYAMLSVACPDFRVKVVKRTDKTVWLEAVDLGCMYKPAKAKIQVSKYDGAESAKYHGWYVVAKQKKSLGWDMLTA